MRARASLYWLVLLSALSLGFSVLHNNGALSPVEDIILRASNPAQRMIGGVSSSLATTLDDLRRFGELRSDNERLNATVAELLAEIARLRVTARENVALREAAKYVRQNPELALVSARVVGRDSSNLLDTILIDQGESSGIQDGMAAVWRGGLVGRVVETTSNTAKILPITSVSSVVNVSIQGADTDADGLATGRSHNHLVMGQILEDQNIEPGQFVVTSGLGGGFPKGILVGQVVNIRTTSTSVLKEADVRPFVDTNRLDTVQIIVAGEGG
ncbi:MAG: rod shape-determining protein MreC [Chloroflexi bacterium]|nr:rod shape-determining protein MreC [Chloroflexota bacterium]